MADLRLLEFVLLKADFDIDVPAEDADWSHGAGPYDSAGAYPAEELLELTSKAERIEDQFLLVLDATLADPRLPFRIELQTGSRFLITDEPDLTANAAHSTLIFMTYPYLRETIANFTSRSPFATYALPPLTKLPAPDVRGDEDPIIVRDSALADDEDTAPDESEPSSPLAETVDPESEE